MSRNIVSNVSEVVLALSESDAFYDDFMSARDAVLLYCCSVRFARASNDAWKMQAP